VLIYSKLHLKSFDYLYKSISVLSHLLIGCTTHCHSVIDSSIAVCHCKMTVRLGVFEVSEEELDKV